MKSFIYVVFTICVFIPAVQTAAAQTITSQTRYDGWAIPKGDLRLRLYGAVSNASGFYDADGRLIDRFRESPEDGTIPQPIERDFSVSLLGITMGIYAECGIFENFTLMADLPVTRWSLHERYSFDSSYLVFPTPKDTGVATEPIKRDRANLSRFSPDYYALGGRYAWTAGNNLIGANAIVRVPTRFKNEFATDTAAFLEDEFLQVQGGVNFGLKLNKDWLSTVLNYNYRAGDFSDELQFYLEFGTRNVETTQIVLFAKYIQSLNSFENSRAFEPRRRPFEENFLLAGGIFEIEFQRRFSLNAGYEIRLAGKNSWPLSSFTVAAAYFFREL